MRTPQGGSTRAWGRVARASGPDATEVLAQRLAGAEHGEQPHRGALVVGDLRSSRVPVVDRLGQVDQRGQRQVGVGAAADQRDDQGPRPRRASRAGRRRDQGRGTPDAPACPAWKSPRDATPGVYLTPLAPRQTRNRLRRPSARRGAGGRRGRSRTRHRRPTGSAARTPRHAQDHRGGSRSGRRDERTARPGR